MLKATQFIYDGVHSSKYGLTIASFDSEPHNETQYVQPNILTSKSATTKRFHYMGMSYEEPPTFEFSVVSEGGVHESILREILMWLDSRRGFKSLIFLQSGLSEFEYQCIFTVTSLIYHAGNCVGLNLLATFDSPFVRGTPSVIMLTGTGKEKSDSIINYSDVIDEYIYPTITFTTSGDVGSGDEAISLSIVNKTDDVARKTIFKGCSIGVEHVVDNELKIISGGTNSTLNDFNKNWFRLLRGKNEISYTINGTLAISCPHYRRISF